MISESIFSFSSPSALCLTDVQSIWAIDIDESMVKLKMNGLGHCSLQGLQAKEAQGRRAPSLFSPFHHGSRLIYLALRCSCITLGR